MRQSKRITTLFASAMHSKQARIIVMVIAIALFVLSAGAPNASIGIGK